MLKEGHIQRVIAEKFGVSREVIRAIKQRKTWKNVPEYTGKVKKVERKIDFSARTKIIQEAIFKKYHGHLEHLGIYTSEDLDKEVAALYKRGLGIRDIGIELGMSHSQALERLKKLGVNLDPYRKGKNDGRSKLRNEDVVKIRKLLKTKITQTEIAKRFGVSPGYITEIKQGKVWRDVTVGS